MRSAIAWAVRAAAVVRRVIGAPDYDRYLDHMRRRHPECVPLNRDNFINMQLRERYEKPGSRCC